MHASSQRHEHQVNLEAVFNQYGVRCTTQRVLAWEFFASHPQGHTIAEAVAALRERGIGQATVYRIIDLFVRLGLLTCTQESPGKPRYTASCPGHTHTLICRGCHTVVEFDDCGIALLEELLTVRTGFTIQGHHLEMYGLCPTCSTRTASAGTHHA